MNVPGFLAVIADKSSQMELLYIWDRATVEGKVVIFCLLILSIVAWFVMISKALQMRAAKKLNQYFASEFHSQKNVLGIFDRRLRVDGCPLFVVYNVGSMELDPRLYNAPRDLPQRLLYPNALEH